MNARALCSALCVSLFSALPASAATVLYQDDFDSGLSGGSWVSWQSGSDAAVDFAYDYSAIGIPSAPRSVGGSTIGTRFLVNQGFDPATTDGVQQGISASPIDQHFTGDFQIRFDLWINFVGPFPRGGSGSTQMASFGWGTTGTRVQWAGSKHSVVFAGSSDGETAQDYRAYVAAFEESPGSVLSPATGYYAAGTAADARQASHPYYQTLGQETAPAAQTALFPDQSGTTSAGTLGMAWRDVLLEKSGESISWTVDGLRIATIPLEGANLSGDNLFLGMFDINNTASSDPNDFLNAAIYDNLVVTVPEPSIVTLLGLIAGAGLLRRRRAGR